MHRNRTTTRRWRARALAPLICAALVAAGCGGDGGDSADAASGGADAPDAPAAPKDPDRDGDDSHSEGDDDGEGDSATDPGAAVDLDDWNGPNDAYLVEPAPGEVAFDADLSADTRVVSPAAVVDASGDHTYVLDAGAAAAVEPGSVLLIPGTALRRVTDVRERGGQVEVSTEFAALTDAIDDGDISWDVELPVDTRFQTDPDATSRAFDDVPVGAAAPESGTVQPVGMGVTLPDGTTQQVAWRPAAEGDLPLQWSYSENGFTYVFSLGVAAEHLDIRVQVTRDVGGGVALAYVAEGQMRMPRASGDVQIRDGELAAANIEQRGLEGQIDLSISAAGAGKAPIDFEMPGIWFKYIIPVGPIPLTVDINARIIGDVEVPTEASAQANASYSIGGDMGFELSGSSVEAKVLMPDMGMVPEPADSAAMIGNYVNAEFGLAFPHMSISLFDQGVVPRIYPGMIIGSRLQWGPVCKTAYVNLVLQGSYDFKILGVNLLSGDRIDLVEPKKIEAEGDSCDG